MHLIFFAPIFTVFTLGLWQIFIILITLLSAFRLTRGRLKIFRLFLLISLFIVIFIQYLFGGFFQTDVYANILDVNLREELTYGNYKTTGAPDLFLLLKTLIYVYTFSIIIENKIWRVNLWILLEYILIIAISFSLLIQGLLYFGLDVSIFKFLAGQPPNFMVSDEFGTRISAGFYEPSHMSCFIGVVIGILFGQQLLGRKYLRFIVTTIALALLFLMSRSIALVAISLIIAGLFISRSVIRQVLGILFIGFLGAALFLYVDQLSFLFRSSAARFLIPDIESLSWFHFLFGIDYGRAYVFIPLLNQLMQFGIVGTLSLIAFNRLNLTEVLAFFLIFSVAPQFWSLLPWMALSIFVVMHRFAHSVKQ